MALGALGLVKRPQVGGLGLFQDRLVDGMSGEQRAERGEHGKHRGGDGRNGHLAASSIRAVFMAVMMFLGGFFHPFVRFRTFFHQSVSCAMIPCLSWGIDRPS